MNRGKEIEQRLAAIGAELEERGAEISAEELKALTDEVDRLKAERKALLEAAQKRTALLDSLAEGRTEEAGGSAKILSRLSAEPKNNAEDADDPYSSMEYRRAFMRHALKGTPIPEEFRAGEITHTTDVGSVIPTPVLNRIIEKMESNGMILPLVTRTSFKGGLRIPTSSVKPVATWVAEGEGSDKQKKTTGEIIFAYHKLRCAVAVTLEVDTMAMPIFEARLIENVVEAMTIAVENAIINGSGIGQPKGILTVAPATGQLIEVVTPSYQDLVAAESALPMAYERNTRWCMTKKTFMTFAGLVDATGQPIGRVNFGGVTNRPERTILGRSVVLCDYLPSYTPSLPAGTPFAFLFNFRDYVLNTNLNMGIKRYQDTDTDDWVTRAVMLTDGRVVDENSLVLLSKGGGNGGAGGLSLSLPTHTTA
ncbi:MAG: phage major capsid protein [Defluviitaleaceae bacterium]|nr:phage major capsid protein [Defluviitaleaceae bacterium]